MRGFNKAVIMGNLAKDPDIKQVNGKKVAHITVAVGRQWKNKETGAQESHTDFINVVAWGFLSDLCEKYTQKGKPVLVEGWLNVRDFIDKQTGQKRWVTEVIAENIILLGSNKDNGSGGYTQPAEEDFPLDFSEMNGDGGDVDIPF